MLETLNETKHTPIENLQHMIEGGGVVMGYHSQALDGPEGIYMSDVLPETALELQFTRIEPVEQLAMGASDTHHEVRFARVAYTKVSGEEVEALVGVKHFDDALENALSECDSLLATQKLGFDAIAPVAIVKESEQSSYLITLFRPDVISLDNAEWAVRPGKRGFNVLTENLRFIARSMGAMHAKGVFHGDAQPKNFLRSDTGQQVIVDLESGCKIATTTDEHITAYNTFEGGEVGSALDDLNKLWLTLNRKIGLRDENIFLGQEATPEELYTVFREHFIIPYVYRMDESTDPAVLQNLKIDEVVLQLEATVRQNLGLPEDVAFATSS